MLLCFLFGLILFLLPVVACYLILKSGSPNKFVKLLLVVPLLGMAFCLFFIVVYICSAGTSHSHH